MSFTFIVVWKLRVKSKGVFIILSSENLVNSLLEGIRFTADGAFRVLHNLKCKVFDDCILVKEATKKENDIIGHLKIELPLKL